MHNVLADKEKKPCCAHAVKSPHTIQCTKWPTVWLIKVTNMCIQWKSTVGTWHVLADVVNRWVGVFSCRYTIQQLHYRQTFAQILHISTIIKFKKKSDFFLIYICLAQLFYLLLYDSWAQMEHEFSHLYNKTNQWTSIAAGLTIFVCGKRLDRIEWNF